MTIGGETGANSAFEAAPATEVVARIRVALASLNIVPSADGQLLMAVATSLAHTASMLEAMDREYEAGRAVGMEQFGRALMEPLVRRST